MASVFFYVILNKRGAFIRGLLIVKFILQVDCLLTEGVGEFIGERAYISGSLRICFSAVDFPLSNSENREYDGPYIYIYFR